MAFIAASPLTARSAFAPAASAAATRRRAAAATAAGAARGDRRRRAPTVLILNTKGGGHAFIGLHVAEAVLAAGGRVRLLNVGDEASLSTALPCARYAGVAASAADGAFAVAYGSADELPTAFPGVAFDVVLDNNSKRVDEAASVADFVASAAIPQLLYISSAGQYVYDPSVAPHIEGDAAAGGQVEVEASLSARGTPFAAFRPIYLVGAASAKRDYLDFFFDRLVRGRRVPIPGSGAEVTSLTDVADVASMLVAAMARPAAATGGEVYNATAGRGVTLDGVARLCAAAVGVDAAVVHYDPSRVAVDGFSVKKAFPFRPRHFFADAGAAEAALGWAPGANGDLAAVVAQSYAEYVALGLGERDVSFAMDDAILGAVAA
ncbi:hypothetical protein BU14_0331s0008 [Porphyra umbilicalis]|uniref:NAD-dependent epimerase/dehydratase domain-containing protein n=1 Tax=Porphyra umbilicalis TaxID=2786 RepID=A0A1X6NYI5_PORUM|nr:hypothetical protein BU14_0331s0008 [Porphyra umbilicalis]|eukprot:OSX73689.1 hypothetical protein BU14_0331s0008 [Porphyra umbilicalis]